MRPRMASREFEIGVDSLIREASAKRTRLKSPIVSKVDRVAPRAMAKN